VAKLITVFWRDIPAQVIGREGRSNVKKQLASRFATAIDRAAMRAGRGSSDLYLSDWRRETRPCEGDVAQAVSEEVAKLESQFPPDVLESVVRAGGLVAPPEASEEP